MTWLLTYGLTNAALVIPLAAIAYLVAHYSRRPALAHLVWIAVLVKLVTPPVISIPVGWEINPQAWVSNASRPVAAPQMQQIAPASKHAMTTSTMPVATERQASPAAHSSGATANAGRKAAQPVSRPNRAAPLSSAASSSWASAVSLATILYGACCLWIAGALFMAARVIFQAWRFQRVLLRAGRPDEWLTIRVSRVAKSAGLATWPEAVVVDGTFSPMLWGVGRSARLVFPADLRARLDLAATDSLLLHELAHYSRGDHWVRLLELAAQVLYWWHPVVWWTRREIEAAEEECCDAWVIEHQQGTRRSYADALLATIDFLNEESLRLPPVASGLGEISLLRHRLTQIMCGEVATRLSPVVKLLVVAWAVVIAPLGPDVFAASSRSVKATATIPRVPRADVRRLALDSDALAPASPRKQPVAADVKPVLPSISESFLPVSLVPPALWASGTSPNGKYRLEISATKAAPKATLIDLPAKWRVDVSSYGIMRFSFSPDDRFTTGHDNGVVQIWDSGTGIILLNLLGSDAPITSIAYSPTGQYIAAGTQDGRVLVWDGAPPRDLNERERPFIYELPKQNAEISCVRWSTSGDRLAISVGDYEAESATMLVWNPTDNVVSESYALPKPAAALRWMENDSIAIVDWNGDGTIYDVSTGEPLSSFEVGKDVPSAASWSPDCPLPIPASSPNITPPADELVAEVR